MPDEIFMDIRVGQYLGITPMEVAEMPNYVFLHVVEMMDIDREIERLTALDMKRKAKAK